MADLPDIDRRSDRIAIDAARVHRMVAAQFPAWANLAVTPVEPGGWDNHTFRLGADMSVRLPSAARYVPQIAKEHCWLPHLAPDLPLPIPQPLAIGAPADGFPWPWSIYRWIDGAPAAAARIADLNAFAVALAQFLAALQRIDARGGPEPGPGNFYRGGPLAAYDTETRQAIAALAGRIDAVAATDLWEAALATHWRAPPVWVHGDVAAGNLLVEGGRLCAVIDFGSSAVGDPACDLAIAWTLLDGTSRAAFRAALPLDAATWMRGRAWTLWKALITLAALPADDTSRAEEPLRVVRAVLADHIRR